MLSVKLVCRCMVACTEHAILFSLNALAKRMGSPSIRSSYRLGNNSQLTPKDPQFWSSLLRNIDGVHRARSNSNLCWEPFRNQHDELQWHTSQQLGWPPPKSRRSWRHEYSRTYGCIRTGLEQGIIPRPYLALSGYARGVQRPWRIVFLAHNCLSSETAPPLCSRCHQTCMNDPAIIIGEKHSIKKTVKKEEINKRELEAYVEGRRKSGKEETKSRSETERVDREDLWKGIDLTSWAYMEDRCTLLCNYR